MSSFAISIDGRELPATADETVLAVARRAGIDIPTLCFLEKCGPLTSCLVCLVKLNGRLVPSCGTKAAPGMVVESETEEVHAARRTALELLFSDHVGDCLSPCHLLCPLQLNVSAMIRHIESGAMEAAVGIVRGTLPLAGVLGRLCHQPCEKGCRRGTGDAPAAIRDMERFVADYEAGPAPATLPERTGKRVAVVGAGPAGLSACYSLLRQGHAVDLLDRHDTPGGTLRELPETILPAEVLAKEVGQLTAQGLRFVGAAELGRTHQLAYLRTEYDAVVLAVGETDDAARRTLGVAATSTALKADPNSCETDVAGVFAAGAAVKPVKQLVRAMAEGRAAAQCVDLFLRGERVRRPDKPFSSVMGRLETGEARAFLARGNARPRGNPCLACGVGLSSTQAAGEASRCLHCDCPVSGDCALQHYGRTYQVNGARFRSKRRPFEEEARPGGVVFEPGKCILCGICVKLTELEREPLGLTFIGRGFDVRIGAPLGRTIDDGLQEIADEVIHHCPTGALWRRAPSGIPAG